jgi:hypothetical protein
MLSVTCINPKAFGIIALAAFVVMLNVAVILGARDCAHGADSILCSLAKLIAG